MRLLVIEDEARIVELLQVAFHRTGFAVDAVGTAAAGSGSCPSSQAPAGGGRRKSSHSYRARYRLFAGRTAEMRIQFRSLQAQLGLRLAVGFVVATVLVA
jgi:hypothetical protein